MVKHAVLICGTHKQVPVSMYGNLNYFEQIVKMFKVKHSFPDLVDKRALLQAQTGADQNKASMEWERAESLVLRLIIDNDEDTGSYGQQ